MTKAQSRGIPVWTCRDCERASTSSPRAEASSHAEHVLVEAPENIAGELAQLKSSRRLLKRIPKGARILVASTLADKIEAALDEETPIACIF